MVNIFVGRPFLDRWQTIGCTCTYEFQVLFFIVSLDVVDGVIMLGRGNAAL
jgi:hypothetical protein